MSNLFANQDLTKYPQHIYYDLVISNTHSINEEEPYLTFSETRDVPLVQYPSLYKMSIIRFMCDTHTLPVMQPTIMDKSDQELYFPNNTDYNRTIYSITIQKGDNIVQKYVDFVPQDSIIKPSSFDSNGSPNYRTSYYDIYTYEHFISMVNDTIKNILSSVVFGYPFYEGLPTFMYDASSKKISFQAPTSVWSSNDGNDYKIHLNTALFRLFNSIPAYYMNKKDVHGRNYQLDTYNHSNNIVSLINYNTLNGSYTDLAGKNFYFITQEYSTCENWSPVASIVFTSDTLEVEKSAVSSLHEYIHGQEIINGSVNGRVSMITDISSPSNYLPGIYYAASEYRWIDLKQDSQPIKDIKLEVHWMSKLGTLHRMKLSAGGSCTMKMLFQKKNI